MLADEKNIPQNMNSISLRSEDDFSSYRSQTGTCKCTEVCFTSFFSGGFITAIVVNTLERRLAKRISNAVGQSRQ